MKNINNEIKKALMSEQIYVRLHAALLGIPESKISESASSYADMMADVAIENNKEAKTEKKEFYSEDEIEDAVALLEDCGHHVVELDDNGDEQNPTINEYVEFVLSEMVGLITDIIKKKYTYTNFIGEK